MRVKTYICTEVILDIDDRFKMLDTEGDVSNFPDAIFEDCIIACEKAIRDKELFNDKDFFVTSVESYDSGIVMAEQ